MNRRVSIIIPVYNVSAYIERCIKSVMSQTYTDIECIIVDDASTDNSIEQCYKLINDYIGCIDFKIIRHNYNRGLSAARNTGTNNSKGDYIYYIDSDDEITVDCITTLINVVNQHPDVEVVQGGIKSFPYKLMYDIDFYKNIDYKNDNTWIRQHYYTLEHRIPVNVWNKLIKRDFITKNSFNFKEGLIHEDELWMYQIVKKLNSIAFAHTVTYIHYCGNTGSITTSSTSESSAKHLAIILKDIYHSLDSPCFNQQLLYYTHFAIRYYFDKPEQIDIISLYAGLIKKGRYLLISFLIWFLRISYKVLKGKFIRRISNRIIKHTINKENRTTK